MNIVFKDSVGVTTTFGKHS